MYLHFMSFLHIDMPKIIEIRPRLLYQVITRLVCIIEYIEFQIILIVLDIFAWLKYYLQISKMYSHIASRLDYSKYACKCKYMKLQNSSHFIAQELHNRKTLLAWSIKHINITQLLVCEICLSDRNTCSKSTTIVSMASARDCCLYMWHYVSNIAFHYPDVRQTTEKGQQGSTSHYELW